MLADFGLEQLGLHRGIEWQAFERLNFIDELTNILKLAIDGGISDKGDGIDFLELCHHLGADDATRHFLKPFGGEIVHDLISRSFQSVNGNRALFAGSDHSVEDLFPLERFTGSIAFDDPQIAVFQLLVGREAMITAQTFSAAANGKSILAHPRINDLVLQAITLQAAHV